MLNFDKKDSYQNLILRGHWGMVARDYGNRLSVNISSQFARNFNEYTDKIMYSGNQLNEWLTSTTLTTTISYEHSWYILEVYCTLDNVMTDLYTGLSSLDVMVILENKYSGMILSMTSINRLLRKLDQSNTRYNEVIAKMFNTVIVLRNNKY